MSTRDLLALIAGAGKTVEQVAQALKVDSRVIVNIAKGYQPMPQAMLADFAGFLGVDQSEVEYACPAIAANFLDLFALKNPQQLPFDSTKIYQPGGIFNSTLQAGMLKTMQGGIILSGDVSGPSNSNTVDKWKNVALDIATFVTPSDAAIPIFNNLASEWKALNISQDATLANTGVLTVTGLQARPLASTAPSTGQVIAWNGTQWVPSGITASSIAPGTAGQFLITNGTPVATWTSLVSVELIHGNFQAGGTGSDFYTRIGNLTGQETTYGAMWMLGSATSANAFNPVMYGDGTNVFINTPGSLGNVGLTVHGSSYLAYWSQVQGRMYVGGSTATSPFIVDWATTLQTQIGSGTSQTSLMIANFNTGAASILLQPGTNGVLVRDSGAVTRASIEIVHGRVTAGGGGSDTKAIIGPLFSSETGFASLSFLPAATALAASNFAIYGDGGNQLVFNTPGANPTYFWQAAAATNIAKLAGIAGSQYAFWLGAGAAFTNNNPILFGDASTFAAANFPTSGYFGIIVNGTQYVTQFAAGTQNGVALGANIATVGHWRTPSGLNWLQRNAGNSADMNVFSDDGANNWIFGDATWTNTLHLFSSLTMTVRSLSGSTQVWAGGIGGTLALWGDSIPIGDHGTTNYLTITPAAAAIIRGDATNTTSLTLGTNKAAATLLLQADAAATVLQLAGGTQDGIALGTHIAPTGHIRLSESWEITAQNAANSATFRIMSLDGANNMTIGGGGGATPAGLTISAGASGLIGVSSGLIAWEAGADQYLDQSTLHLRSAAHTEYITITPITAAVFAFAETVTTSATITYIGRTSNAPTHDLTIQGQYAWNNVSATGANRTPGNIVFDVGAPTNGSTTEAIFKFTRNGTEVASFTSIAGTTNGGLSLTQFQVIYYASNELNILSTTGIGMAIGGTVKSRLTANGFLFGTRFSESLNIDWTTGTTPLIQATSTSTSLTVGTNKSAATLTFQADAASTIMQLAGGTQAGLALGSNLAAAGHIRSPNAWAWYSRNGANSADDQIIGFSADALFFGTAGTTSILIGSSVANIQLGSSTGAFGSGTGVIGITDRVTAPTTNPSGGGVLYSESGALKWRGSSGSITTIAVA